MLLKWNIIFSSFLKQGLRLEFYWFVQLRWANLISHVLLHDPFLLLGANSHFKTVSAPVAYGHENTASIFGKNLHETAGECWPLVAIQMREGFGANYYYRMVTECWPFATLFSYLRVQPPGK